MSKSSQQIYNAQSLVEIANARERRDRAAKDPSRKRAGVKSAAKDGKPISAQDYRGVLMRLRKCPESEALSGFID